MTGSALQTWHMACPECGCDDSIDINANVWIRLCPDGTDLTLADSVRLRRRGAGARRDQSVRRPMTNIASEHRAVFQALTSGAYANFALFSYFVNGQPGAEYTISPQFAAVTLAMVPTNLDGYPCEPLPRGTA
jgi:hypothetical protein